MATDQKNVYYWSGNRNVYFYITTRPTNFNDLTPQSQHHYSPLVKNLTTAALVLTVAICISVIICIICKLFECCTDRACRPSFHQHTEERSDITYISSVELHTFGSNNMPQDINGCDQPPNYNDAILTNCSTEYTRTTEIPESPPPNYDEQGIKF